MPTINKEVCPTCGQSVNKRQITLFSEMVTTLFQVYKWCKEHQTHEFKRKDVKHFFTSENVVAHFGDWVFFGGLVYKEKKGSYGLHMGRCYEFFAGTLEIPTSVWKDPMTEELEFENYQNIKGIPHLSKFLDENQEYIAMYGQ